MRKYRFGLVSVIMPTYKRSEKLIRAIESVFNQTYTNIELILVNDNNPDDQYTTALIKMVEKYSKLDNFRLIIQEQHINGAVARNIGIKKARGEYIAFLDDDDWWKPNKIEEQVNALSQLPDEWGGVSCKIEQYNVNTIIAKTIKYPSGYIYKDILLLLSDVATGTLLLRHTALDEVGYFDERLFRHQDLQLLTQFTYKYKLYEVNKYLHCCDISDPQNRPNVERLVISKKEFFMSIKNVMDSMNSKERRDILIMHDFELGYVMLRYGMKIAGFRKCLKVMHSPRTIIYALRKMSVKLISHMI